MAGLLAGITTAHRYQLGVVVAAAGSRRCAHAGPAGAHRGCARRAGRLSVLSPYTLLEAARAMATSPSSWRSRIAGPDRVLSLPTLLGLCRPAMALRRDRLARSTRRTLTVLVALVPLYSTRSLLLANWVFARYTIPILPLLALFAAAGVLACA
jgi:hypothetical protein